MIKKISLLSVAIFAIYGCSSTTHKSSIDLHKASLPAAVFKQQPLIPYMFTADPSAHVFDGKLWIYPSHDIETKEKLATGEGSGFDMRDYHVFSMDTPESAIKDWGPALKIEDIPWAKAQLWAPDAAEKNGKYYLFFPAKDNQGIFRIGVAVANQPQGPFKAEPTPIDGTYSIDPSVYQDGENYYLYVGGIRGGQLQQWENNIFHGEDRYNNDDGAAHPPKMAKLSDDLKTLAEPMRDVLIVDNKGAPLANKHPHSFFEAPWIHKFNNTYYLTYSTGDTRSIAYATSKTPYGPFTYQGAVLEPVYGWTNHHSIVEFNGKWYLFYHDSQLSGGKTHLRNIKVMEISHDTNGKIRTESAFITPSR
jgi:hypothetical protein